MLQETAALALALGSDEAGDGDSSSQWRKLCGAFHQWGVPRVIIHFTRDFSSRNRLFGDTPICGTPHGNGEEFVQRHDF